MSKADYMGVSPSQVSDQTGNHSSLKQTTSGEVCEFGDEHIHGEPLESKLLLGSEAAQIDPQETSSGVTKSPDNEKLPTFCGDVLDNSLTEHLVLPPEDVSKSSQTNDTSYSQQNASEQKHEIGSECAHSEQLEQKLQLDFHIVCNEPKETSSVIMINCDQSPKKCSSVDNDKLRPVSLDVSKHSQTYRKQTVDLCSGNGCIDLDADSVCRETLEQKRQLDSEIIHIEPEDTVAVIPSGGVHKNLQTRSKDMTKIIPTEPLKSPSRDANNSCQAGEKSCPQQSTSEWTLEVTAGIAGHEPLEVNNKLDFQLVPNKPTEMSTAIACNIAGELGSAPELVNKCSPIEHLKQTEVPIRSPISEHLGPYSDDVTTSLEQLETPSKYAVNNSGSLGRNGKKDSKASKKKYMLRSLRGSDRVLRSGLGKKSEALESSNSVADVSSVRGRRRKKWKTRKGKIVVPNEYSRIRTHLRYLVNRINYEQSLIAAYSGEGWKGLSIEKLKPQKELQRATSEILRRKLKIRDLFQHLDSLCAEGRFPKSLFDSEGQIDSEDIFCAKCGSKDLSADNDIILCDGACDRGFHQYCLEPPLLKEDIPPDDEGWLCPGCDCKVDCIDLVNESQGTNLFITDKWEKFFPEAAAVGHNQDPNFGLPSDDSDDNDYDPDGPANEEEDQVDESSSDESDFTSASDDSEVTINNKKYLGHPSDDSEDDEYNPDAPEVNEKAMLEWSSSDFTSDFEDLTAVLEDSGSSGNEDGTASISPPRDSNGNRSILGGNEESLNNELLSILESGQDGAAPVYGKRSIERLDYKKLYDETYGHAHSDSSDDEDWTESAGPMNKTKSTEEGFSASPNGNAPGTRSGKTTKNAKKNVKEAEHIPKRRGRRKLNSGDSNVSHEGSSTPASHKRERSSYRRLGEDVTQKLCKSFNENHYPDRSKKEALAKELGLTFSQVRKWFENTRWSFNHSSSMDARMGTMALEKWTCIPQSNNRSVRRVSTSNVTENVESPKTGVDDRGYTSENVKDSEQVTEEVSRKKPASQTSRKRKRKGKLGHQASRPDSKSEVIRGLPAGSPKVQETRTNGRTRRRKNSVG